MTSQEQQQLLDAIDELLDKMDDLSIVSQKIQEILTEIEEEPTKPSEPTEPTEPTQPTEPAVPSNYINVKSLGAKADGKTDDSIVINNALQKYDNLYFPKGIYYCASQLSTVRAKCNLLGDGKELSSIIFRNKQTNRKDDYLFQVKNCVLNASKIDITYESSTSGDFGNKTPGQVLIKVTASNGVTMKDCSVKALNKGNAVTTTCFWAKPQHGNVSNITIDSCYFENTTKAGASGCIWFNNNESSSKYVKNVVVKNCKAVKDSNDECFCIWGDYTLQDFDVYNNDFEYLGSTQVVNFISVHYRNVKTQFKNIKIHDNKFIANGKINNVIKVGNTVDFYNNEIVGNISGVSFTRMFFLISGFPASIHDNTVTFKSSAATSVLLKESSGGNVSVKNNVFNIGKNITIQESGSAIDMSTNKVNRI